MNTMFTNSDEANCHISSGDAFSFVQKDDTGSAFTNSLLSLVNPTAELSSATVSLDIPNYVGSETNIEFKVKYLTFYDGPTAAPLYYTLIV